MCGKKCLNTQSVACQNTDSIVCTDVCLPATPTPQTHTPPTRGQGTSSSEGARRHLSSWYLGTGLGVVCPVLLSFLCWGMAKTHDLIYLLCLESHGDRREGGPTWSIMTHSLVIGLAVWRFYVCDWRHLGQVFLVGPQSRVQTTWSRKMPVWHPHRWWWTWWTWRGGALQLCRVSGSHTFGLSSSCSHTFLTNG